LNLGAIDPELAVVDRWLERRSVSGAALAASLDALIARRLGIWSERASAESSARARAALEASGLEGLSSSMARPMPECDPLRETARPPASASTVLRPAQLLARMTGTTGSDAYEAVEQAFRRSLSRLGARFVAKHARAAIDDDMGPMHSTVVAAELFSMLERLDARYLEALTFALENLHDWGALTTVSAAKTQPSRTRKARTLSSPKRRA